MRIAFFSEVCEPQVNGIVVTLARVTEYLRDRGHTVLSVVPRYPGNLNGPDLVRLRCIPFPLYPEMPIILPHWSFHKREFNQIAAFQPDLVHIWTSGVISFFAQKWARSRHCPVVASYETDLIRYLRWYGFGKFESQAISYFKWLFNNCARTYVPSRETQRFLEQNGIRNVEVLARGVNPQLFNPRRRDSAVRRALGVEDNDVLVLYVGRFSKEKDIPVLIGAFMRVLERFPGTRLALTGEGPLRHSISRKFSHPNIVFTGVKRGDELAALFASADIFAIPSSTETLSIASLEAMSSGLPVLGMNAGGIRNVVIHMKTGLLAASADEFSSFLELLVRDATLRSTLAQQGRIEAEQATWSKALEALERSYLSLLPLKVQTS